MARKSKEIVDFMTAYTIADDEIWEVHNSTWVVKHKALERVAAQVGIVFDRPAIVESNAKEKIAVICVFGELGERKEWSFGEASPANNKNAYCYAMAEKRAKDRVILKLLNKHGELYSESEADEFQSSDSSGTRAAQKATLPKKDSRQIFDKLQSEINQCQTREQLKEWSVGNADRIKILPEDWQDILRMQYQEMSMDLKNKEAA